MSYLNDRKYKMEKVLFEKVVKQKPLVGVAIIFLNTQQSPRLYRFEENTYQVKSINDSSWSEVRYIYDMTWEEFKKIIPRIIFIEKDNINLWEDEKRKSFCIKLQQKINEIMLIKK